MKVNQMDYKYKHYDFSVSKLWIWTWDGTIAETDEEDLKQYES
ncbi:MAG: hypothetical protein OEV44_02810 [Spirochaetota bacterium]|nr:hypothetical protein [Spirochaetota bacterium]